MNTNLDHQEPVSGPPAQFDAWRVADSACARAYSKTGDRGRALIKSCIAALFPAIRREAEAGAVTTFTRFHSGTSRSETLVPRPWFILAVGPDVVSPAQLVAAILPAVAKRIPLVAAFRTGGRGGWPPAMLTALELCGVEQVFASTLDNFKLGLQLLLTAHGPGAVACLGAESFWSRIAPAIPGGCFAHWLDSPRSAGLVTGPGIHWELETLAFSHAGVSLEEIPVDGTTPPGSVSVDGLSLDSGLVTPAGQQGMEETAVDPWAVFSPEELAPETARLVLAPGREFLWDWPDMPGELFNDRRLVYS